MDGIKITFSNPIIPITNWQSDFTVLSQKLHYAVKGFPAKEQDPTKESRIIRDRDSALKLDDQIDRKLNFRRLRNAIDESGKRENSAASRR